MVIMTIMYVYLPLLSTKSWLRKLIRRKAFELNASGLIFVHNHPSGDLKPSQHDLSLREKLNKACRAVDLTPLDHLIIGPAGYISFKEKGLSEMLVLLPPPPEQKKIAEILTTLDDAIEKTTQCHQGRGTENQMINRRLVRTRNARRNSVEIKNSVDIIPYLVDIREN